MKGGKEVKEYPEKHQYGFISIEQEMHNKEGDLGAQIAKDGRIWICIDGQAAIRFKPTLKKQKRS